MRKLLFTMAFISLFLVSAARAQPGVDRATREVTRPVREEIEKKLITAPKRPARIKEAPEEKKFEGPSLFVKSITLDGVKTFPVEDFRPLVQKYENREVYESELKDVLAKEIEREYLKKGVIAACFIPPQEIKEGAMTLRVVEAKMGKLETARTHFFNQYRLPYYWTIKAGNVLRYEMISRSMQMMNKNPDREVKATLHAGEKPETTDVLLTSKTSFPLHFTAMMDNEGSVPTGKIRKGFGIVENNMIGLDDTLMVGYTGGKNFGGVYAYHKVPITNFGTTVMYGYSNTRAFPKKDFEQFGMSSMQESYSAFLYQDLFYKDEYKGEVSAGLEAKNKRVVATNGTINADRLRFLRLGTMLVGRDAAGFTYIKPEFSQGMNFFGARRQSEYSSRDASNTPTKVTLLASHSQRLVKDFQAVLKFNGQYASEKLMPQEELYMGGIDSIRSYPSGDYLADTGFFTNMEVLVPAFFMPDWLKVPYGEKPIKDEITGVFFFDYGYGMKRGMINGEQSKRNMSSLGAGVRIRLLNQATLRLEWGFPLQFANLPFTEFDRSRLHFSIDFQDQLPKEAQRLSKEIKETPNPLQYYSRMKEKEVAAKKAAEENAALEAGKTAKEPSKTAQAEAAVK